MTETEAARVLDEVAKESPRLYERLYFALVLAFRNVRKAHPARSSYSVQVKTVVSEMVTEANRAGEAIDATRSKRDVLDALRALEAHEFGGLFLGRRGHKTRFTMWLDNEEDAAFYRALRARVGHVSAATLSARRPILRHAFALRPGFTVSVELPADLSRPESVRLAQFVRSLPFEAEVSNKATSRSRSLRRGAEVRRSQQ